MTRIIRGPNRVAYIASGKALRELMQENILRVGSGFSFYNRRVFSWEGKTVQIQLTVPDQMGKGTLSPVLLSL